jgi:hypothetical protein
MRTDPVQGKGVLPSCPVPQTSLLQQKIVVTLQWDNTYRLMTRSLFPVWGLCTRTTCCHAIVSNHPPSLPLHNCTFNLNTYHYLTGQKKNKKSSNKCTQKNGMVKQKSFVYLTAKQYSQGRSIHCHCLVLKVLVLIIQQEKIVLLEFLAWGQAF